MIERVGNIRIPRLKRTLTLVRRDGGASCDSKSHQSCDEEYRSNHLVRGVGLSGSDPSALSVCGGGVKNRGINDFASRTLYGLPRTMFRSKQVCRLCIVFHWHESVAAAECVVVNIF